MNPAHFSNMGMQPIGPQGVPQQGGPQRPANPTQAAQARIFQLIQLNQQHFPTQGWQTTLPIQQRAHNVFQIFSQVRLIKNDLSIDNAIQVAIQFEQKTFQESPDRNQYDQRCRSKMEDIAKTRAQQASKMQQQFQNGQPPQMNTAQQQMQMQGMPNMNQQQLQQQQQQMQQRLLQQQQNQAQGMAMQPQAQMQMGNPQARMQGMPPNMPQQPVPTQQQLKYTPQEQQEIQRKIQELYSTASRNPDHMNKLSAILQQNNPNAPLPQLMRSHFQQQALKWFEEVRKAQRAGQLMAGPQGVPVPQQTRPISQDLTRAPNQQPTPVSAPQSFDASFMGSVDQMRLSALRSQENGQVVVPASQPINPQQRAVGGAPQATPQNPMNRPAQTPQIPQQPPQMWNQQSGQPPQPANLFPNGMNGVPQNVLQGQTGGLNNVARTPQQNANMPNLNRAFGPQAAQPNGQPPQNAPQMGQQNPVNAQQFLQNGAPRLPNGMTAQQFQQVVQQMPDAEQKAFLMKMQASQRQRQPNGQGVQMQAQRSQPGQPMPVKAQAVQNAQPTPRPTQQNVAPQQSVNGQAQSQQTQTQPQWNGIQQAARAANNSLTTEQEQQMDMHHYPTGILNTGNALSQLPPGIKTWGQLKQWVKMNASTLPLGSEQKLRGLQGLHYQSLQPKKGLAPQGVRNAAPPAQMTPRPNQPPANLQNLQIPQPTPQEINNLREKHPQLASLTDDIIQGMVMKHRTQEIMRRRQEQLQQHMLQRRQAAQNPGQNLGTEMGQAQQPAPPAQRPQPQQTPKMNAQAKSQPTATPQMPAQTTAMQKGIKRPSSDDVFEVPNPNVNQQRPQTKPPPKAPAANMGQIPQKPTEAQKSQSQVMQREKSNAPPPQAPTQTQPKTAEMIKSEERYKSILNEVRQATPQRQPVPMDADTRRKMLEKLASARELITRMGPFLAVFYQVFNDENGLRNLSRVYLTLAQQYRNEQVKLASPVEHFTIGLEELESNITTLHGYFNTTMDRMNRQKALTQKVAEQAKQSTLALSAANLQQHQNNMKLQHQNNMKKENNRAPPAPTSAQPRNPWGPYSPQGVAAVCDGQNQLTQDKLQLPALKKIKHNTSAENTPAHIQGTPIPAASPLITKSPEIQKTPAPVMLRCPVPNCSESRGYTTQIELDKHMMEHETKEPSIDDPLKFALEQMQLALNLDKNGKAKPKAEVDPADAPKMKQSASSQGVKQESATPMSRVPTGPSPASKSKTPQPHKTPAPSSSVLPDVILPDDPWAASSIRPDVIQEAFSPLSTLQGPRTWTKIQDYLTPESSSDNTDPSNPSPRLSDVSEHDAVKISMDVSQNPSLSKNWIPIDWMDPDLTAGMDDFELLDLNVEPGVQDPSDMDWEALFNETEEEARARASRDKARVQKELEGGGTGVTEEFGRIYGFGEIEPKWS